MRSCDFTRPHGLPFTFLVASIVSMLNASAVHGVMFDFNNGTNQGWTSEIAAVDTGVSTTILSSASPTGWLDTTNYPGAAGGDPIDNRGSIVQFLTASGLNSLGLNPSVHDWAIVGFQSPDLSSLTDWQTTSPTSSFSARIWPGAAGFGAGPFYANLLYFVTDGSGSARIFTDGSATLLSESAWNEKEFTDIGSRLADAGVTDYTVDNVGV